MKNLGCITEGHTVPSNINSSVMKRLVFLPSIKKKINLANYPSEFSIYQIQLQTKPTGFIFMNCTSKQRLPF